jgi:dipeptidyl aminopeptidase/acylaminoacyl peptidase
MLKGMALFDEGQNVIKTLKKDPKVKALHVMGFSAGGHFAGMMTSMMHKEIAKTVLCYPVVTATLPHRHQASFVHLMGRALTDEEEVMFSLEKHVPDHSGPLFLMFTNDDETVSPENSRLLMKAYQEKGLDVVTCIFDHGPHGVSLATKEVSFESMDPIEFERLFAPLQVWFTNALAFLRS